MKTIISLLALASLAVAAHAADVTFAWDASPDADITGYRLKYGAEPGKPTSTVALEKVTTGTVTGLEPGQQYYVVVTAVNAAGLESAPSNEVAVKIPNAPGNLRIEIKITVGSVTQDLREPRIIHKVEVESSSDLKKWQPVASVNGNIAGFTLNSEFSPITKQLFWRAK